jgi:hypothetical protein
MAPNLETPSRQLANLLPGQVQTNLPRQLAHIESSRPSKGVEKDLPFGHRGGRKESGKDIRQRIEPGRISTPSGTHGGVYRLQPESIRRKADQVIRSQSFVIEKRRIEKKDSGHTVLAA